MGMGTTNETARIAASLGKINGVAIDFQACVDVAYGGVLLALPALLANGLLKHTKQHFSLTEGYYTIETIFLLLGFMALARIKVMESLRFFAPGEWGKFLGIDRIPEVKIMRQKIHQLVSNDGGKTWSAELCKEWMETTESEYAGYYYVDGHVRVYYGGLTKLLRHYVSRQRLCLRATIDYWINAMDGQPFFLVNKAVDPGLLKVLTNNIVPRLEAEVPNQPRQEELDANPYLHRFSIVFDREGYSPDFMQEMKSKRIACITYNKYPKKDWAKDEFNLQQVKLVSGEIVEMELAERGTCLSNGLWLREIRKMTETGHQTSVLATDYISDFKSIACGMFARWCQEAFFKYMRTHFNLDRLFSYETENIPDTTEVVNPQYRKIDRQTRSKVSILSRKLKEFGALALKDDIEPEKVEEYQSQKAKVQEEILLMGKEIEELKAVRKSTPRHITFAQLSSEQKFDRLSTKSKYFIDTIKMIAYRAETSMANILIDKMSHSDEARRLLQSVYKSEVDIIPDKDKKTLTVRLHHQATHSADEDLAYLCENLNDTETVFPGTDLRVIYELGP